MTTEQTEPEAAEQTEPEVAEQTEPEAAEQTEPEAAEQTEPEAAGATSRLATTTLIAAIVTAMLAVATFVLALRTQSAAEATEKAAQATEKAAEATEKQAKATTAQAEETRRIADAIYVLIDMNSEPFVENPETCNTTELSHDRRFRIPNPERCTLKIRVRNPAHKTVKVHLKVAFRPKTFRSCVANENVAGNDPNLFVEIPKHSDRLFTVPVGACLRSLDLLIPDPIEAVIDLDFRQGATL